jgi:hypothetical protein
LFFPESKAMSKMGMTTAACVLLVLCIANVSATRSGDENFGADPFGQFFVFADKAIHVINPGNLTVVKNITADQAGNPLTSTGSVSGNSTTARSWNDAVFVQDTGLKLRYVLAAEADTYLAADNVTQYGYVSAVDAVLQQVVARIKVGARPVHMYSINQTSSVWAHSDAEGTFYVIPLNNSQNISVATTVRSYTNNPGHGKLVVNDDLYPLSYGTNVNEQIIPKHNLENETNIGHFPYNASLSNATLCSGTHTIVYSRVNKHLYIECVDGSGTLEWNTANDTLVTLHDSVVGVVTGAPADDMIFVGNSGDSAAVMVQPGKNGVASTVFATLQVPFNPIYPAFYSNSSSTTAVGNYTDYQIFFPLTRNTNINNIKAAGDNVTTEAYMEKPTDCSYGPATVSTASVGSSSPSGLTLATASNGTLVTPTCGACAAGISSGDPSQFNASLSGFGTLNLEEYKSGAKNLTTSLLSAGATLPSLNEETGANQCSFSTENNRLVKRGGPYIALPADLPQPSLYIVNSPDSNTTSKFVGTATNPHSVVWVPADV